MSVKKRGLGKGLDALLGARKSVQEAATPVPVTMPVPAATPTQAAADAPQASAAPMPAPIPADGSLRQLPVEFIQSGKYQPRMDIRPEALEELAASIKTQGVMQPIVVRPLGPGKYEIIAGERRWRACQLAGLGTIPALIKDVPDEAAIAMALIENIQREDLNPIEEAFALKRLQDEFELTQQEVADAVGKSRTAVTNLLRLMSLQPEVRTFLEHGDLEMGHARALLSLDPLPQSQIARVVIARGLNVRQTEALVRRELANIEEGGKHSDNAELDPDIRSLQDELSQRLGAEVMVEHTAKGKGRLILKYASLDQLDGILARIR
ncbi:MAG: ParB/RepB/Spo0J family partition protein [Pseudomonadales bacterium]|jgi:ParB family chromosome partitioning protein|nr:ParB/RepB/Spo0J family partition protein [Pseudomonadales bacterium]